MRFTEAVENNRLRGYISDLLEYTYNWEQFDPVIIPGTDVDIQVTTEYIYHLLDQVEQEMQKLGKINRDSFEY
jgi:hypothetical protein